MNKAMSFVTLAAMVAFVGLPSYFLFAHPSAIVEPVHANSGAPSRPASAPVKAINWSSFAPLLATAPLATSAAVAAVPGANGKIVFASERDDNQEIYAMDADGANQTRLTYHPAYDGQPRWSPDGARIAFISRRESNKFDLYLMNADGTNQKRLTNNGRDNGFPCWSPDGTRLVFISGSLMDFESYEIYVINADGTGPETRLTNNTVPEATPAWSPDGTRIAFTVAPRIIFDPNGYEIYVMNANGTNRTRLTNNSVGDALPAWSPDGARLVFTSAVAPDSEDTDLFLMNADGSNRTRLTSANTSDAFPAWSPDGTKIVYASADPATEQVELFVTNSAGGGSAPVRLTNNSAVDWFPDWQAVASLPPANTIQFSAATFQADETLERATITVLRGGNVSAAATVEYSTIDDPAAVRCDAISVTSPGAAYARCDYATSIDTLSFAAGQAEASFTVPLINDAHLEPPETVRLKLSNPSGATLGANSTATLTINSDETTVLVPNPIFGSPFFVRQQYLDFLSREPEQSGLDAWLNVLNNCSDVHNNPTCDRIHVSSSFFRSDEFQLKGYFVYLFYRVALNRRPNYDEIIPDLRGVTGQTGDEVARKRAAFARQFTLRPEFRTTYDDSLLDAAFVGELLGRYNAAAITTPDPSNPDGTQFVTLTREELISRLSAGTLTRAQVLRAVVQSREVDTVEFRGAFVATQYYGYLRRAPEEAGYQGWLNYLNANPNDFRTMVNGFMNSEEYRLRFGRP